MTLSDVSFSYGCEKTLNHVSVDLPSGRLTGLLGPNGAGKTTLFKCCLGFLTPSQGFLKLMGAPLRDYSPRRLARHIAYVPQDHQPAFPFLVQEMVEMGRTPHRSGWTGMTSPNDLLVVKHVMERVGVSHLSDRMYSQLSAGQRQLTLVARALAQEAALVFLDEPTSALDFSNQLKVWDSLRQVADEGVGMVVCSHDPNHVLWFCDDVIVMRDGAIIAHGPVEKTITRELLEDVYRRNIGTTTANGRVLVYPDHNSTRTVH